MWQFRLFSPYNCDFILYNSGFITCSWVYISKAPFTPRTITIKITILARGWYHLFIPSARASATLNSRARYSDSDWLKTFVLFISWKKNILKVIPTISFLCVFIVIAVAWTLLFFNRPVHNKHNNYKYNDKYIVLKISLNIKE